MSWIYLILAAVFEIGWPLGFKLSHMTPHKIGWIVFAVFSMTLSGFLLYLAQKTIPIGTAYAIWTGIGASGTFLIGILFFNDPTSMMRYISAGLIVLGIIGLKISA